MSSRPIAEILVYGITQRTQSDGFTRERIVALARCVHNAHGVQNHNGYEPLFEMSKNILLRQCTKKQQVPEGQERLSRRKSSVEPVFGNLKSNLGFRRFRLRDMQRVKGEFILMCIGHNLNKLFSLLGDPYMCSDQLYIHIYAVINGIKTRLERLFKVKLINELDFTVLQAA